MRDRLLRKQVYERDKGICAICGRYDPKWQHDHIQPIWQGGPDTLENSQTLCRNHHTKKCVGETPIRAKSDRIRARHEEMKRRREIH